MTLRPLALATTVTLSTLACQVVVADDCDHTAPREAVLDAAGARNLVVEAGSGSLSVRGVDGSRQLQALGTACASRADLLEQIRLEADRRGDTLYVRTRFPRSFRGNARLDLEVEVPAGLHAQVEDGSGSTTVRNVASLQVEDGSGSIDVAQVTGDVSIEDGSGSIDLADVRGEVRIDDGSGSIAVLGVGGSVVVSDGSGEIELQGVGGSVRLTDGSGTLRVRDTDGDVVVAEDGSGGIVVQGVGGSVLVQRDGSGSIRVEDVRGDLTVEADGSGGIDYSRIDGRVSLPRR